MEKDVQAKTIDDYAIGRSVIIRTYSAGVWHGTLLRKCGREVVLADARRLWRWFAISGISLSEVALYGVVASKSRISAPVSSVWLEAIEITPTTAAATATIDEASHATGV